MRLAELAVLIATFAGLATGNGSGCQGSAMWTNCDVANSGSQVDISATGGRAGVPPGSSNPPPSGPSGPGAGDSGTDEEPEDCGPLGCRGNYEVVTPPDLTIADLASFRPGTPTLTGEPAGFAVVGMPANLVAAASEQIIAGTVLDWDVRVRFTPVAYEFAHGDGTGAVAATGGASWDRLGQAQFTPTATSHVYRERGTFDVHVTVRYAASVDFGSGRWRPVPGYVTATAGGYEVRVVEVRTALVDQTCAEDPSGPGC